MCCLNTSKTRNNFLKIYGSDLTITRYIHTPSNPHTNHVTAEGLAKPSFLAMSTSNQTTTTVECRYPNCDTVGKHWKFRDGRYCSTDCDVRHDGLVILRTLKYDHCHCFTCFRELKTVNPPKPDFEFTEKGHAWTRDEDGNPSLEFYDQEVSRQAAVGFQFPTEHSTTGEKQRGEAVVTGTICNRCGNTDHTHHDQTLADHEAIARLARLLGVRDDIVVDPEGLHREYAHTQDLPLAVGRALSDNDD